MKPTCILTLTIVRVWLFIACNVANALICTESGNRPVENRGWPRGAEKVANLSSRQGYWVGPPFGGGRYSFDYWCKNTAEFNEALRMFAAIKAPKLEMVVHDGPHYSPFLGEDRDKGSEVARIDWRFTVWNPASWHRLHSDPRRGARPLSGSAFMNPVPPPKIDLYVGGGSVVWQDVKVPSNVDVTDKRVALAPVEVSGGGFVRANVFDMATGQPIPDATVTLARHEGCRNWVELKPVVTDGCGTCDVREIPDGNYRIRIRAKGYSSRAQGSLSVKGNCYHEVVVNLSSATSVRGVALTPDGTPIEGVEALASLAMGIDGKEYDCFDVSASRSDEAGCFELQGLPKGFVRLLCRVPGRRQLRWRPELYRLPPLDHEVQGPIKITMAGTGTVRVQVKHTEPGRPLVAIRSTQESETGIYSDVAVVTDGVAVFGDIPAGDYMVGNHRRYPGDSNVTSRPVSVVEGETAHVLLTNLISHTARMTSESAGVKPPPGLSSGSTCCPKSAGKTRGTEQKRRFHFSDYSLETEPCRVKPRTLATKLPSPEEAVVFGWPLSWECSHWARSQNTDCCGEKFFADSTRFIVTEPGRRKVWVKYFNAPIDPQVYPLVVMTYRAINTHTNTGGYTLYIDDSSGPNHGGLVPFRQRDLVADDAVHTVTYDLSSVDPYGDLVGLAIGVQMDSAGPAVFDLIDLRFENLAADRPKLQHDKAITVHVVNEERMPLSGATVTVDAGRQNWTQRATTDHNGMADVVPYYIRNGRHLVQVSAPGMLTTEIRCPSNEDGPVQVVLGPATTCGGTVVNAEGKPVQGASVH